MGNLVHNDQPQAKHVSVDRDRKPKLALIVIGRNRQHKRAGGGDFVQ
jgi:hypothetical protein